MIADIIHDFDDHLKTGKVYLVEVEMGWEDGEQEPHYGTINYDVYLVANTAAQAAYIASTLYPDALSYAWSEDPITSDQYVSRRNRSNVQEP